MEFSISTTVGVPIYQQLAEQIRGAMARGRLCPNERLPSVRELSQTLVVNPNTVARAYTELEREGSLYTRPGLGVFVCEALPTLPQGERWQRLLKLIDPFLVDAVRLGCSVEEVIAGVRERSGQFQWNKAEAQAHE